MDVTARTGGGGRARRPASPDPTAHERPESRSAQPDGALALDSVQTFDEFYMGTRGQLLRQLTAMTADPELAKDVLQEAYARAWQRWSRVASMEEPTAWVRTVAWRLAVSQHRRVLVADRALRLLRVRPEQMSGSAESTLDVESALRQLSPTHRRVLVLHDMCGFTLDQIAVETGVPVGTVKSRLSRGRAALVERLGPAYRTSGSEPNHGQEGSCEA